MAGKSHLQIAAVVAAYFVISISLVFSNKLLMSDDKFSTPIFVTWFQCIFTALLIGALGLVSESSGPDSPMKEFTPQDFSLHTAYNVLPLSIIFVGMVTFNNLCLVYVEVSFYNLARSLTIVFNVIFTYTLLGERTSYRTIGCLFIVIIGFFLGSNGELNFSLIGTLFGVASSVFVSLNSIYTKKVMKYVNNDKWRLAFYNNVNATWFFMPLIFLFGEHKILLNNMATIMTLNYWFLMTVAGLLGFAIGIATVMQINYTSPLTHNISGTAKACVQTILSLAIWPHETTLRGNAGLGLTIMGTALYAYVRTVELDQQKQVALPVRSPVSTVAQGKAIGDNIEREQLLHSNGDIEMGNTRK